MKKQLKNLLVKLSTYCLPILLAFLGAETGSDNGKKWNRRFIIPLSLFGTAYSHLESILTITIMSMMGAFSLGYGIPGVGDEGSALGRFWSKVVNTKKYLTRRTLADIFTRGTIGLLVCATVLSIPIINKNWVVYAGDCLCILLAYSGLSWRGLGRYWLFGKELLWSETLLYGTISSAVIEMIFVR